MQAPAASTRRTRAGWQRLAVLGAVFVLAGTLVASAAAQLPSTSDPRNSLTGGWLDAAEVSWNITKLAHRDRPAGFVNPANPGDFGFVNSDPAFQGDYAFLGNFNGFQIYDIADPSNPTNVTNVVCPGGQGDVSVYGNLLFMSVEETRAKIDCTLTPAATATTRFRGVRVFDISNINAPVQVAAVQTCRGSHTHTIVTDPDDPANVFV